MSKEQRGEGKPKSSADLILPGAAKFWGLDKRSKNQTASIVYIKMAPVTTHNSQVKGSVNINYGPAGFAGIVVTKLSIRKSISTCYRRSDNMVKSPTTASQVFCSIPST